MVAVKLHGKNISADCLKSGKTTDLVNVYQNFHQQWKDSQVAHVMGMSLTTKLPAISN